MTHPSSRSSVPFCNKNKVSTNHDLCFFFLFLFSFLYSTSTHVSWPLDSSSSLELSTTFPLTFSTQVAVEVPGVSPPNLRTLAQLRCKFSPKFGANADEWWGGSFWLTIPRLRTLWGAMAVVDWRTGIVCSASLESPF
jgi:hypothetical protein